MRMLVVLSSLALAFAAGAQATSPKGTLTGIVMRGPVVPVCAIEQPCDEPAPNVTLLFMRDGSVVGRALTDKGGHYRVRLPGGVYDVRRPSAPSNDKNLAPNRVRVVVARTRRIDFAIDTGIR